MTTITPTAIDAFVHIESIRLVDRHRRDLGDLTSLAESIRDVGLLNPVTIRPDNRLVAGQRRLEALRILGEVEVPVRIVDNLDEVAQLLRAERDENTERKDMLLSEKASLGEALYAIEAEQAKERQRAAGRENGRGIAGGTGATSYAERGGEPGAEQNKSRTVVATVLDMSPRSYTDLRYVYRVANGLHADDEAPPPVDVQLFAQSCLAEMDRTGTVKPHSDKVRAKVRARRDAQEAKAAALAEPPPAATPVQREEGELDPSWIPGGRDSSVNAVRQRRKLIAYHAARGLSSRQIAEIVGIEDTRVRKLARDGGIDIPADAVVGRQRRIDPNRVVRETVYALEGSAMAVQLVNVAELDRAEIGGWTASLTDSIRALNRLVKQLKELAS